MKTHTCCGQRVRARIVNDKIVEQPHKCNDDKDVKGIDWSAMAERITTRRDTVMLR